MVPGDIVQIETLDDPRVAAYVNLKDRELAREGGRFIAEGELVVRRLLDSGFEVESLLLAEHRVAEIAPLVPPGVPIHVATRQMVHRIVGFKFHSGVMACGRRGRDMVPAEAGELLEREPLTLVVCPEISNTENLGSMIRIAAALGADAMLLGERSCDPFYRQSVRVSMGAVFRLPILRSADLLTDLAMLRQRWQVELIATVLDERAEPLAQAGRGKRIAVLFGNEAQGLGPQYIGICDRRVTIPMRPGVDSLNVSVAAGIVMYHFTTAGPAAIRP